jgi:hypothetical protein
MKPDFDNPADQSFDMPDRLRADLKRACTPQAVVPKDVDDAVMSAARRHLGQPVRPRLWRRWIPAAAAALLALTVWLGRPARIGHELGRPGMVRGDCDANGRVDILDAFVLARRLERDTTPPGEFDFNSDGRVDRGDVDVVAGWAVRLERG